MHVIPIPSQFQTHLVLILHLYHFSGQGRSRFTRRLVIFGCPSGNGFKLNDSAENIEVEESQLVT